MPPAGCAATHPAALCLWTTRSRWCRKGGATIRGITDETGASIDISDDGTVRIYGETREAADAAVKRVEAVTAEAEIGAVYEGKVVRLMDFGAFVQILPGKDGLVHISQISEERVERVSDKLKEGDVVQLAETLAELDETGSATAIAAPAAVPDLIALPRPDMEVAALKGLVFPVEEMSQAMTSPYCSAPGIGSGLLQAR